MLRRFFSRYGVAFFYLSLTISFFYSRFWLLFTLVGKSPGQTTSKWLAGFCADGAALAILLLALESLRRTRTLWPKLLLIPVIVFIGALNYTNLELLRVTGNYLTPDFFAFFGFNDIGTDLGLAVLISSLKWLSLFFVALLPLALLPVYFRADLAVRYRTFAVVCLLAGFILASSSYLRRRSHPEYNEHPAALAATFYFDGALQFQKKAAAPEQKLNPLNEQETAKQFSTLEQFHSEKSFIRPFRDMPYFKIGVAEYCALPSDLQLDPSIDCRQVAKPEIPRRKNVILISLESFRAISFDGLSPLWSGITPKMANHMRQSAWFSRNFTINRPTNRSLSTIMCSIPGTEGALSSMKPFPNLLCLSDILSSLGYHSACLSAVRSSFQNFDYLCNETRFDEVLGGARFLQTYNLSASSWMSTFNQTPDDRQFLEGTKEWLRRHYKHYSADPFFILLKTATHHPPWPAPPGSTYAAMTQGPELSGTEETLASHKLMRFVDDAVGDFLEWLKNNPNSDLAQNTIVVVFGDHGPFYLEPKITSIRPEDVVEGWVPMFFQGLEPKFNHEYQQVSGSYDIAPSILGILGVNAPNAFIGQNLFGDRQGQVMAYSPEVFGRKQTIHVAKPWKNLHDFQISGKMDLEKLTKGEDTLLQDFIAKEKPLQDRMTEQIVVGKSLMPKGFAKETLDALYGKRKTFIDEESYFLGKTFEFWDLAIDGKTKSQKYVGAGKLCEGPFITLTPEKYRFYLEMQIEKPIVLSLYAGDNQKLSQAFWETNSPRSFVFDQTIELQENTKNIRFVATSIDTNKLALKKFEIKKILVIPR